MRLVILSYRHHGRGIGQTICALGHDIIGVMDGEEGPRQQLLGAIAVGGGRNRSAGAACRRRFICLKMSRCRLGPKGRGVGRGDF